MEEKRRLKFIEKAAYHRQGGSIYALVPAEVKEFLGLGESGEIAYYKDLDKKRIIITKPDQGHIVLSDGDIADLDFSVSDDLADKILKKK